MSKRANTEGTIYKVKRNGRLVWCGQISTGYDKTTGRRTRRTVYGKTQDKAREKLEELRGKAALGVDMQGGRERVLSYLQTWLTSREENGELRRSTVADYRDLIGRCIDGTTLARKRLEEVRPADVRRWLGDLGHRGLGVRTRQRARALLRAAFEAAIADHVLLYNAAARVEAPKAASRRVTLGRDHVLAMLGAAEGSPFEAALVLAALHGLRIGEIAGLSWADVDMAEGVLTVRRQLCEDRRTGERYFADVKTAAGRRQVPLSGLARAALGRLRERVGATPHPGRLLFADGNGAPLRRSNFHRRVWVPIRDAAKLPEGTRFHDLRHAAASAMLGAGQDAATVSGVLGHSSPAVTLRVYAHALPDRMREAAARVDALYGGAS